MTDLLTDKEQIEAVKQLWRRYGVPLVIGMVLALIAQQGWQFWKARGMKRQQKRAGLYEVFLGHLSDKKTDWHVLQEALKPLQKDAPNSAYVALSHFQLAKFALEHNQEDKAEASLKAILAMKVDKELQTLARLRLARVMLSNKNPQAALSYLEAPASPAWSGMIALEKSHAYTALNQPQKAKEAAKKALSELPADARDSILLDLQLKS